MRGHAWIGLTLLLAGCSTMMGMPKCLHPQPAGADCSYGLTSVTSVASFGNATWNATVAMRGMAAAGYPGELVHATRVASPRSFSEGNTSLVAQVDRAIPRLQFEVVVDTGLGLTHAEATELGQAKQSEYDELAERILVAFEKETGWTRDGDRTWHSGIVVT